MGTLLWIFNIFGSIGVTLQHPKSVSLNLQMHANKYISDWRLCMRSIHQNMMIDEKTSKPSKWVALIYTQPIPSIDVNHIGQKIIFVSIEEGVRIKKSTPIWFFHLNILYRPTNECQWNIIHDNWLTRYHGKGHDHSTPTSHILFPYCVF